MSCEKLITLIGAADDVIDASHKVSRIQHRRASDSGLTYSGPCYGIHEEGYRCDDRQWNRRWVVQDLAGGLECCQ